MKKVVAVLLAAFCLILVAGCSNTSEKDVYKRQAVRQEPQDEQPEKEQKKTNCLLYTSRGV